MKSYVIKYEPNGKYIAMSDVLGPVPVELNEAQLVDLELAKEALSPTDGIDYIESITKETDEQYSVYDFNHPMIKLRNFLWESFTSHYIELVKSRAYNQEGKFTKEESNSSGV